MNLSHWTAVLLISLNILLAACTAAQPEQPIPPAPATPDQTEPTPLPATPTAVKDNIVIGAILFQNDNFFETVALGMEETAEAAGADILFRFHEHNVDLETQWIKEFTEQGVDAIVISPRVEDGSVNAIQKAYESGIKIVCFNGCFTEEATDKYVSAVFETDQYDLGYQVGEYLAGWLAEREMDEPHVGILSCCDRREAGFRQALTDNDVAWSEEVNIEGYLAEPATAVGETILQNYPQVNILWAENEGGTIGAVNAVRRQNKAGEIFVFGIDISPQLAQMLLAEDDILQAVGAQSPRLMGNLAVQAALDAVTTGQDAGYNHVPTAFYSRDDREAIETYLQTQ